MTFKQIPCRLMVFADRITKRKKMVHVAWQDWNFSPFMEMAMARLPGSGSFYWPSPRDAVRRALVAARAPGIRQVKVETIGGREVARVYVMEGGRIRLSNNLN